MIWEVLVITASGRIIKASLKADLKSPCCKTYRSSRLSGPGRGGMSIY